MTMHGIVGTVIVLAVTTAAVADFNGIFWQEVSDEVGTPDGLTTYRFYATFTDADDQIMGVGGDSWLGPVEFSVSTVLVNDGGAVSGLKQEDFAYSPLSAAWDSWVTIDHESLIGNDTNYSSGFLDGDGVHAVIVGDEWSDANGGWFDGNPGLPALAGEDLRVLIAQFTVLDAPAGDHIHWDFRGVVTWLAEGSGNPLHDPFEIDQWEDWECHDNVQFDPTSPPADIDADGTVGFDDMLAILSAWGVCEPAFDVTWQQRHVYVQTYSCPDDCDERRMTADGYGRFDQSVEEDFSSAAVTSVTGDDRLELNGSVSVDPDAGSCDEGFAEAWVRLRFFVHESTEFAFTASAPGAQIALIGPGVHLVAPVETTGVLAPGLYRLNAVADVEACCGAPPEVATLMYALDLAAGRCAADIDRDGVVGFADLLDVLSKWSP